MKLFVYGTLKQGFDNHNMLKNTKFIGMVKTVDSFAMFVDSSGYYPYLLKSLKAHSIKGELYEVNSLELLEKIDEFEGVPELYVRESIWVQTSKGKEKAEAEAEAYFLKEQHIPKNQEPIDEWVLDNDYFIKAFEEYYQKAM